MKTRKSLNTGLAMSVVLLMMGPAIAVGGTIYVDASAAGANNGTNWTDAFNELQSALAVASSGDQVWVAEGTYKPSQLADPGDARTARFQLISGVALYGGFPSGGGDRDPAANETILSGDVGIPGAAGDNCYHVVTTDHTDAATVLDGFIITAGNADGVGKQDWGGGMYNYQSSVTVANCTFRHNTAARRAGGMYNKQSAPTVTNCTFVHNSDRYGGGMYNQASHPIVTACTFTGNSAENGGGMFNGSNSRPTLIDCTFAGNVADAHGGGVYNYGGSAAILTNCTFRGNSADGDGGGLWNNSVLTATDCTFRKNTAGDNGGGMWNDSNSLTVDNCTLSYNVPDGVWIEGGTAQILGIVRAVSNDLAGNGNLHINPDATLSLDSCFVLCNFSGLGSIEVDPDSELVIGGNAVIDLGDPNDPNVNGEIGGGTHLHLEDNAVISNAIIKLSQASFDDNVTLFNCVIIIDNNGPYMPVFMEPNVSIIDCVFRVDGDRYAEMTPKGFNGVFADNKIYVTITEGMDTAQGCLFELRGKDGLVAHTCEPNEYMCQVDPCTIPDCNLDTWTIEQMDVYGKVNLTNRFPFQPPFDPGTDDDVLYARRLILHENSVFNTSYNRVYCETLVIEPNAAIVHVPLLGFSLINITFDDLGEYRVRVTHNNSENPDDPNFNRDHITRVEGNEPDPNGMMLMCSLLDTDPNSPTSGHTVSALAKGVFAKTGESEDRVLAGFEYMFVQDPCGDAELIVYLSDRPEVDVNLVPVASITPPGPNRPGAIGSGQLALFSGNFPRGDLNFYRGTYVALELRGTNASCWINNLDPQVNCTAICGDFYIDMFNIVNVYDYLVLLAELGLFSPTTVGKGCLDLVTDGCINSDDLAAWGVDDALNKCPSGGGASASSMTSKTSAPALGFETQDASEFGALFILGKPPSGVGTYVPNSYLYSVDGSGTCAGGAIELTCPAPPCGGGDGQIVAGADSSVYQLNGELGLVNQNTATVVVEPSVLSYEGSLVSVGFDQGEGFMLLDAAFNPDDPNIVYVVPVSVDPQDGNCPYMAAAKLELTGDGNYDLLRLYGKNPSTDPCQCTTLINCEGDLVYEPDVQHLHEVEIDSDGNNLFVLSAHSCNQNNWILVYDEETGNDSEVRVSLGDANLAGPVAMVVSSLEEKVYLASSAVTSNELMAEVYCFSINKTGHTVTGLAYDGHMDINCPEPNICETYPSLCNESLGYSAVISSMVEDAEDGTLYVTGYTAPRFAEGEALPSQIDEIFTTPILAALSPDTNEPVEAIEIINCDPSLPLVLPLSILWMGPVNCSAADLTGDHSVNFDDFVVVAQNWLDDNCFHSDWCNRADMSRNNAVGWKDLAILASYWLETGCVD
ncbi:MAG: right-handed parallel beta-helix repeat-containing protein [Planctomycetota bacterium]